MSLLRVSCSEALLLTILWLHAAAEEKPAWMHSLCWWNAPSEECLSYVGFSPVSWLTPKNKCDKTTISSATQCGALKGSDGRECLWKAEDTLCTERICSNFDQTVCSASKGSPFNCLWDDYECGPSNTNCKNTGSYSSEASCTADAAEVGPCVWKTYYTTKCQQLSCTDSTNESSCIAATSKVPAMTFLLGSAPYGKTPCHWHGSQCSQIYHCANYDSQVQCKADAAGFGSCLWDSVGAECLDMLSCRAYTNQSSCVADSFKSASRSHPQAQCWWDEGQLACDTNLPSLSDYIAAGEACDGHLDQATCDSAIPNSASTTPADSSTSTSAVHILLVCLGIARGLCSWE